MSDDPPPSTSASISGSTISGSTIHQSVTHQAHPWQPRWEPSAAEAQLLLDTMPTDCVPAINCRRAGRRGQ